MLGPRTPFTHLADIFRSPELSRLALAPQVFTVEEGTQTLTTQMMRNRLMGLGEPHGEFLIPQWVGDSLEEVALVLHQEDTQVLFAESGHKGVRGRSGQRQGGEGDRAGPTRARVPQCFLSPRAHVGVPSRVLAGSRPSSDTYSHPSNPGSGTAATPAPACSGNIYMIGGLWGSHITELILLASP